MKTKKEINKIAILRASSLGDFLFCLPAMESVKTAYPAVELIYLGRPWHKAFLENRQSPIDRVIVVPVSHGVRAENGEEENTRELNNFFKAMTEEKFDIALQWHGGGKHSNS